MNRFVAILFALSCVATSFVSGNLLGVGMWFWVILATGFLVAASQFHPSTQSIGAALAGLLGVVSVLAVVLGLVAATIGGSFKLEDNETLLLLCFFLIAVFGFALVRMNKKRNA